MATKELSNNGLKANIKTLGNAGDLTAPPGSLPWAIAVRLEMQSVLHDAMFNAQQLKAWRDLMKEYNGYKQLVDENGNYFKTYEELCQAKPPFGLGCESSDIDQIIKQMELANENNIEVEDNETKHWGSLSKYLKKFSKIVHAFPDNQPINVINIVNVLHTSRSNAHIWRRYWLDLGWIERLSSQGRGYYQITEEGRKVVSEWLEKVPSASLKGSLWLTIPRHNSKKAAEQLIQGLDSEQLKEIYDLIYESLNMDSS